MYFLFSPLSLSRNHVCKKQQLQYYQNSFTTYLSIIYVNISTKKKKKTRNGTILEQSCYILPGLHQCYPKEILLRLCIIISRAITKQTTLKIQLKINRGKTVQRIFMKQKKKSSKEEEYNDMKQKIIRWQMQIQTQQ